MLATYLASQQNKKRTKNGAAVFKKGDHGLDGKWFSKRVTTNLHQEYTLAYMYMCAPDIL